MEVFRGVRVLVALLFITSCNVSLVRNGVVYSGESDENVLRWDGLYQTRCTDLSIPRGDWCNTCITYGPVNIMNSNMIDYCWGCSAEDSSYFFLKNYYYRGNPKYYIDPGNYIVRNDTIYANIPIYLHGNNWLGWYIYKPYECSFIGRIKNRDTIVDWHLVPPYPNIKIKENYMDLVRPRMLYFIESEELLGLDSLHKSRKLVE